MLREWQPLMVHGYQHHLLSCHSRYRRCLQMYSPLEASELRWEPRSIASLSARMSGLIASHLLPIGCQRAHLLLHHQAAASSDATQRPR